MIWYLVLALLFWMIAFYIFNKRPFNYVLCLLLFVGFIFISLLLGVFALSKVLTGFTCYESVTIQRIERVTPNPSTVEFVDTNGHTREVRMSNTGRYNIEVGEEVCVDRRQNEIDWFSL